VSHVTTISSGLARSSTPSIPSGLPVSTTISNELVANVTGSPALRSAATSLPMLFWSAEANTSTGAPSLIWAARSDEAAKLNVTSESGWAVVKASPMAVKASVSEAAANTVMSPDGEVSTVARVLVAINGATSSSGNGVARRRMIAE
jgi:hypothetical protein